MRLLFTSLFLLPCVAAGQGLEANQLDCSAHFSKWDVATIERIELTENPHMYVTLKDTESGDVYHGHAMPVGNTYEKYSDPSLSDLKNELGLYWQNGFRAKQKFGSQEANNGTFDDGVEFEIKKVEFGRFEEGDDKTLDMRLRVVTGEGVDAFIEKHDFPSQLPDPANSTAKDMVKQARGKLRPRPQQ